VIKIWPCSNTSRSFYRLANPILAGWSRKSKPWENCEHAG
jgi:hypothetical protein